MTMTHDHDWCDTVCISTVKMWTKMAQSVDHFKTRRCEMDMEPSCNDVVSISSDSSSMPSEVHQDHPDTRDSETDQMLQKLFNAQDSSDDSSVLVVKVSNSSNNTLSQPHFSSSQTVLHTTPHFTRVSLSPQKRRLLSRRTASERQPKHGLVLDNRDPLKRRKISPESTTLGYKIDGSHDKAPVLSLRTNSSNFYTLQEFKAMWTSAETDFGLSTEEIERGSLVKAANQSVGRQDSDDQAKAQYGRLSPEATATIFHQVLTLNKKDTFVDIGHGIGNNVLQASYTIGCQSRGIELVESRNFLARQFWMNLEKQHFDLHVTRDGPSLKVGSILMRHGRLEEPIHRDFISKCKNSGRVKAFVNNFNGVFADRSAKASQDYYLDNFISGLFARMQPGSILVTLHPLLDLPLSLIDATEKRKRHKMKSAEDVSFYEVAEFNIGKARDCVSWSKGGNTSDIIVYRYKRVEQKC